MRTPLQGIMREWRTRSVFRLLALLLCFVLVAEVPLGQLLAMVARRDVVPGQVFAQTLSMPPSEALTANPDIEAALWVAKETVLKLAADNGTRLLDLPDVTNARAVAVDEARRVLWAFGAQTLYAYHVDGTLLPRLAIPSPTDPGEGDERVPLVVNPRNDTVWLGQHRDLNAFSADGVRQFTVHMPHAIQGLAVVPQAAWVWVATQRQVLAYDETGTERQRLLFGMDPLIKDLALRSAASGELWVALKDTLQRYAADGSLLFQIALKGVERLASDGQGNVWAATDSGLLLLGEHGQRFTQRADLSGGQFLRSLVADPRDLSVWAASRYGLAYRHGRAHRAHHYPAPSPAHP